MKVLLTGATGFIGSYVARDLIAAGHSVVAIVRPTSDRWRIEDIANQISFLETPNLWSPKVEGWISSERPEAVAHIAWGGVLNNARNDFSQFANIADGAHLIDAAASHGAHTIVAVGSQAEYGPSVAPTPETAPTNPTTYYGASKLAAGHTYGQICKRAGVRYSWLRFFSTYGPKDHGIWMIPYLIKELSAGRKPALTPGEQLWDYLYVTDAARAVVTALTNPEASGFFNVGYGEAFPLRSFIEMIRDAIDPALPLGFGEMPYRDDQVMHLQADVGRLRAIGWQPEVAPETGIRQTVEWFRESHHSGRD